MEEESSDENDNQKYIPRNAKFSKNIGEKTVTGDGPIYYRSVTRSGIPIDMPEWGLLLNAKTHPRHKPT